MSNRQNTFTTDLAFTRLRQIVPGLLLLIILEISISGFGMISPRLLPAPSTIVLTTIEMLGDPGFQGHIMATLYRTLIAATAGIIPGILLGVAMGWSRTVRAILFPPVSAFYPLPKISLLPLFLLVFGKGEQAFIITAALGCIFLVLFNSIRGVEEIDDIYIEAARDNDVASIYALFREILIPGALPQIFTGLRLALGTALVVTVGVEFVGADNGLGYFIWISYSTYVLPNMWAGIVIVGIFGMIITYGVEYVERVLIPWQTDGDHAEVIN